jgi:hypothetical protein
MIGSLLYGSSRDLKLDLDLEAVLEPAPGIEPGTLCLQEKLERFCNSLTSSAFRGQPSVEPYG